MSETDRFWNVVTLGDTEEEAGEKQQRKKRSRNLRGNQREMRLNLKNS